MRGFSTTLLMALASTISRKSLVCGFSSRNVSPRPGVTARFSVNRPNSAPVAPIHDDNYRTLFSNNEFVLVDAQAKWCGPCRLMDSIIHDLADKYRNSGDSSPIQVAQFDVEDPNVGDLKLTLALENVLPRKLPSFILFRNGRAVGQREGVLSKDEIRDFLNSHAVPAPSPKGRVSLVSSLQNDDDGYMLFGALNC